MPRPLSPRQKLAVTAVLIRATLEEVALETGFSEQFVRQLLRRDDFRAHLVWELAADLKVKLDRMLAE